MSSRKSERPPRPTVSSSAKNVLHSGNPTEEEDERKGGGESGRVASLVIAIRRTPSSTNAVRRGSEPRILGDADDLRLAAKVEQRHSAKVRGGRGGETKGDDLPTGELDEDRERDGGTFEYSHGITTAEAEKRLLLYGPNELPEKVIPKVTRNTWKVLLLTMLISLPSPNCSGTFSCRNCGSQCQF